MDVQLRGKMKGTEAARRIWQELGLPVGFSTAYSDEKALEEASASMPGLKPRQVTRAGQADQVTPCRFL
jgi:hypothetical protein